jgi:outer membrane protein
MFNFIRINKLQLVAFLALSTISYSQQKVELTVEEIFQLAVEKHPQLKINQQQIVLAEQQKNITKLNQLPSITTAATASYIGDVELLNPDFSKLATQPMPHFGNSFNLQVTELIYKGGLVKKSLEANSLQIELAQLNLDKDEQAIKKLILSYFLDSYKLANQIKIYTNNLQLANKRLTNISHFYKQGMITRNEVLRAELMVKSFEQALLSVNNSKQIIDYNIALVLDYPLDTSFNFIPSDQYKNGLEPKEFYLEKAFTQHPSLKTLQKQMLLADKQIEMIKTDYYPTVALFAGYNSQRPVTTRVPALDLYANAWQTGVSVAYNLDNLYKTKEKKKLGEMQKQQVENSNALLIQNVEMSVNAAFIKYQEAIQQLSLVQKSKTLAEENYKIMEAKYLNQLAIQTEMVDASNTKLETELNLINAEINIIAEYYQLIYTTGTL